MTNRSKIIKCRCQHKYQDDRYGKGFRVHNYGEKNHNVAQPGWKCTVCGSTKPA